MACACVAWQQMASPVLEEGFVHSENDKREVDFTYDLSIPVKHTYLGELQDVETDDGSQLLQGGAIVTMPVFYLEGVCLFPEDILPLRMHHPRFKAALEHAMQATPRLFGVVHIRGGPSEDVYVCMVGTTAEIQKLCYFDDGSVNLITRGCQRFRICHAWTEPDGVPWAKVQVMENESFLQLPKDAFGKLASTIHLRNANADHDQFLTPRLPCKDCSAPSSPLSKMCGASRQWAADESRWIHRAQRSHWPHWVYRLHDVHDLAIRAADLYKQLAGRLASNPRLKEPEALSFFIASRLPLSDGSRIELLETNGAAYRLRKMIGTIEHMQHIRCKFCKDVLARCCDIIVMTKEGPVLTFVTSRGFAFETLTLWHAGSRLQIRGHPRPQTEHSWFPGYAWVAAFCECGAKMGWHYSSVSEDIRPPSFWGIRRCQIDDNLL